MRTNAIAAVVRESGGPFIVEEVNLDDPRPDEVLIKVAAAGICHTDIVCRDQWFPVPLPVVLGHEGSGVVQAIGSDVTLVQPGDRVVMSMASCRVCENCRTALRLELRRPAPGWIDAAVFW